MSKRREKGEDAIRPRSEAPTPRLSKPQVGAAGEYFVAAELSRVVG